MQLILAEAWLEGAAAPGQGGTAGRGCGDQLLRGSRLQGFWPRGFSLGDSSPLRSN